MSAQATLTLNTHDFLPRGSRTQPDGVIVSTWSDRDHVLGGQGEIALIERFTPARGNQLNHKMNYYLAYGSPILVDGVYVLGPVVSASVEFKVAKSAPTANITMARGFMGSLVASSYFAGAVDNLEAAW